MQQQLHFYEDKYINVAGVRTRYWDTGKSDQALILLHGMGGSIEQWLYNIPVLAQQYRVIALDMVGYGLTGKPRRKYDYPYFACFLDAFLAALDINQPHIMGQSMGGAIALQFALLYPENYSSLILVAQPAFCKKFPVVFQLLAVPLLGELLMRPPSSPEDVRKGFESITYKPFAYPEEIIKRGYEIQRQPGYARPLLKYIRNYFTPFGLKPNGFAFGKSRQIFKQITKPVLYIWGRQDAIVNYESAATGLEIIPGSRLHTFEECGHNPEFEYPDEFNTYVLAFLKETGS